MYIDIYAATFADRSECRCVTIDRKKWEMMFIAFDVNLFPEIHFYTCFQIFVLVAGNRQGNRKRKPSSVSSE